MESKTYVLFSIVLLCVQFFEKVNEMTSFYLQYPPPLVESLNILTRADHRSWFGL